MFANGPWPVPSQRKTSAADRKPSASQVVSVPKTTRPFGVSAPNVAVSPSGGSVASVVRALATRTDAKART
jgi:hypothetical protein